MRRVVTIQWKKVTPNTVEVFSNLKILCASYTAYNYNTINNYLSKSKIPFENEDVRIERKIVKTSAIPVRKIVMIGKKIRKNEHDEELVDFMYWQSRPVIERLDAVQRLRAQVLKKGERMNRSVGGKKVSR